MILWNATTLQRVVGLPESYTLIRSLSFSRDSSLLAAAALHAPTIVWDLDSIRQTLREMNIDW